MAEAALMGDTVRFDNVTAGLWGEPAVAGDTLTFTPLDFRATQAGGPGVDFVTGSVAFDVWASPGFQIAAVVMTESGDSFLVGDGQTIVDGTLIAGTAMTGLAFPSVRNASAFVGPGGSGFDNPEWAASAAIDLAAPVVHLRVVLENELLAIAPGALDVADVNKALATVEIRTVAEPAPLLAPEPSSLLLLGLPAAALLAWRRRDADMRGNRAQEYLRQCVHSRSAGGPRASRTSRRQRKPPWSGVVR
jgi:hypothetical protein